MENLDKAILKLNKDTRKGDIKWRVAEMNWMYPAGCFKAGPLYVAKYEDRVLVLTKFNTKYFVDEDRFEWIDRHSLDLADSSGFSIFSFPNHRLISDLYDSVQIQHSDISGFLKSLLKDDEDLGDGI